MRIFTVFLLFLLFFCSGCNKLVTVSGKVTYPDGTPVTGNNVIFTTKTYEARGILKEDGTYSLTSLKPGDGVPPGIYTVYFDNPVQSLPPDFKMKRIVNEKYCSPSTSGLTCEIKGKTKFNFTIEKP
ncbi:MAG: carboxypeptidase-like regulatory domain-containing protein [Planctomycetaceae bacterium]|jgi:hypothetical protein|nr:carboxypeptidase-like regulatory domain-containing protein [Planctomycetaceae bacterium]